MNSFLSQEELNKIGFKKVGNNVLLSRKASIYGMDKISIGNDVRIDDFCILSGNITIGNHIHIAAYTAIYGATEGVIINDFANLSSRVCVYAICDDFSGKTLTNPMIPDKYKNVQNARTIIGRHVIIGSGSTVLHGVTIGEGVAIGAMSLVNDSLDSWKVYAGIPCKLIKDRNKNLLEFEKEYINEIEG